MGSQVKLVVPELGDFTDVEVIEILVAPGDKVAVEDPMITLETDKATMDVPASNAGTVVSIEVAVGYKVNAGDVFAIINTAEDAASDKTVVIDRVDQAAILAAAEAAAGDTVSMAPIATTGTAQTADGSAEEAQSDTTHYAELVVIGAGPGGYTAAFRAADLGLKVILVERSPTLGGVCLNVGCIPSKALLHAAKVIDEAAAMAAHGVKFGKPEINASALRDWKDKVVSRLTGGLTQLAKQRKVQVIHGTAKFASANHLELENGETIGFGKCIIAAGSEPAMLARDCRTIRESLIRPAHWS